MDSGPEIEAHRHKTGHSRADLILALLAIVLSAISLWVAMKHGEIMERMADANARMVTASSWPNLVHTTGNYDPEAKRPAVFFRLQNNGVGPARIDSLEVFYRGRPLSTWGRFITICCRDNGPPGAPLQRADQLISDALDAVVPAGGTINMLKVDSSKTDPKLFAELERARNDVTVRACYCSVFDECWVIDNAMRRPERVGVCRPSQPVEFSGSAPVSRRR